MRSRMESHERAREFHQAFVLARMTGGAEIVMRGRRA